MKWLVTGSHGFLGQAITAYLQASGFEIVHLELQGKRVDLLQKQALRECLRQLRPTAILHLAGRHGTDISAIEFERCHVEATLNLLEAALPHLKRWISVGSAAEYGLTSSPTRLDETSPCRPQSAYGRSKWNQTQSIQTFCQRHHIPWVVFRAFNVFGPQQKCGLLIPDTLARLRAMDAQSTQKIPIRFGEDRRDFVPIDILCQMVLGLIQNNEAHGIYNACSGQGTSVATVTSWLADELGFSGPLEEHSESASRPPTFSVGEPHRIRRQIGQQWPFDLEFEIRRLARQRELQ
jgi:nucleoside-diphosphate-sugar epimerase